MKKYAAMLLCALWAISWIAPVAHAESPGYALSISMTNANVGDTVQCTLTTPDTAQKAALYIAGKQVQTVSVPQIAGGSKQWIFSISFDTSGTKRLRFYVYDENGKLLKKFPDSDVIIRVTWPLYAPVAAAVAFLESDMAVLQAKLAPGYTYKRFGFYLGLSEQALNINIRATTIRDHCYDKLATSLKPGTTYYFQPYAVISGGKRLVGEIESFTTPAQHVWTVEDTMLESVSDKYNYLFFSDAMYYTKQNPPTGYRNASEASRHMVTITVPVWKKVGKRRKASTWKITVNRKLAANVQAIFADIYALDIRFPIASLKCFGYRTIRGPGLYNSNILSHHSFGAAIDINKAYNPFYRSRDKRNPQNPYTIPQEVIAIFEKNGWSWGGNFSCGLDTMHFQYLGLDLIP